MQLINNPFFSPHLLLLATVANAHVCDLLHCGHHAKFTVMAGVLLCSIDGYWATRAGEVTWPDLCCYSNVALRMDALCSMVFFGNYHKASITEEMRNVSL